MKHPILITLTSFLLLSACATPIAVKPDAEERGLLSTKMVNLSAAVESYFLDLPEMPVDDAINILRSATRHDPRLLASEFEPYVMKVQYQKPYAVLLLCNKDGNRAIMEDAGCSARLDRQVTDNVSCEFTLFVNSGCQVEGADPL